MNLMQKYFSNNPNSGKWVFRKYFASLRIFYKHTQFCPLISLTYYWMRVGFENATICKIKCIGYRISVNFMEIFVECLFNNRELNSAFADKATVVDFSIRKLKISINVKTRTNIL